MTPTVRPWPVLAEKNFALFWFSILVSSIGSQLTTVAVAWQVYEMTDSPAQLGLVGFFRAVPLIAFALTGGWLADRVERRRLLIAAQALGLVLSLALGFLSDAGRVQVWHIRSEEHTSELQSPYAISYAAFCFQKSDTGELVDRLHPVNPPPIDTTEALPL